MLASRMLAHAPFACLVDRDDIAVQDLPPSQYVAGQVDDLLVPIVHEAAGVPNTVLRIKSCNTPILTYMNYL